MSQFTRIVRPNQSININPPKRPDTTASAPRPNIVVLFGADGSGKVMNGDLNFRSGTYQDRSPREAVGGGSVIDIIFSQVRFANGLIVQG